MVSTSSPLVRTEKRGLPPLIHKAYPTAGPPCATTTPVGLAALTHASTANALPVGSSEDALATRIMLALPLRRADLPSAAQDFHGFLGRILAGPE